MTYRHIPIAAAAAVLLFVAVPNTCAQPTPGQAIPAVGAKNLPFVSPIFVDNMVLQRDKPDAIWGWSDPGDTVRVEIGENSATATAGPDRRWQVEIQPPASGGPYTVKIVGHQTIELHNVLVGDVWLCGGQSNMGLRLRFTNHADEEIKAANYPGIRFFTVQGHPAYHHVDVIQGDWRVVSPETASWISAVGYYFARKVREQIHVPIGLVVDAVGGSPAEAWASEAALRPLQDFDVPLAELVERMDTAYVNGVEVGASAWVENPRVYFIRPGILKPERNVIAIRVLKTKPDGGFLSKPEAIYLTLSDQTKFHSPATGKPNSVSTLARRNHCPSPTRTGPSCPRSSTRECSRPSRPSLSPAPSGTRASRTLRAAFNTAKFSPR